MPTIQEREAAEELEHCVEAVKKYLSDARVWRFNHLGVPEPLIKFLIEQRADAVEKGNASYREGFNDGQKEQALEDAALLKQVDDVKRLIGPVEGDQTLLDALTWKMEEEERKLRTEPYEVGWKASLAELKKMFDDLSANVAAQCLATGATPTHEATHSSAIQVSEIIKLLLERGPKS